jgi:hypothetical protein
MITLSIADKFSRYPGPRYRKDGPFSGEQFRDEQLIPAMRQAIESNDILIVTLDDVAGYGSSFLEEAFGGLLRQGFTIEQLAQHLDIHAKTERFQHHRLRAQTYIAEAARRPAQHVI